MHGLEELEWEIRELSPQLDELKLANYREIPIAANWKNSVENYSECYHCPNQHPSLASWSKTGVLARNFGSLVLLLSGAVQTVDP